MLDHGQNKQIKIQTKEIWFYKRILRITLERTCDKTRCVQRSKKERNIIIDYYDPNMTNAIFKKTHRNNGTEK